MRREILQTGALRKRTSELPSECQGNTSLPLESSFYLNHSQSASFGAVVGRLELRRPVVRFGRGRFLMGPRRCRSRRERRQRVAVAGREGADEGLCDLGALGV